LTKLRILLPKKTSPSADLLAGTFDTVDGAELPVPGQTLRGKVTK